MISNNQQIIQIKFLTASNCEDFWKQTNKKNKKPSFKDGTELLYLLMEEN